MLEDFKKNGFSVGNQDYFIFNDSNMDHLLEDERNDDLYVEYVKANEFSSVYLSYVEKVITAINEVIFPLIEIDDSMSGKCTQLCSFISYLLCKLKVNSFQHYGSLLIEFSNSVKCFSHVYGKNDSVTLGHYWIFVPPFKILDLSIGKQNFSPREAKYIHGAVIKRLSDSTITESRFINESHLDISKNFGVYIESHNGTKMHYFVKRRFVQMCRVDDDIDVKCTDPTGTVFKIGSKLPSEIFNIIKKKIDELLIIDCSTL